MAFISISTPSNNNTRALRMKSFVMIPNQLFHQCWNRRFTACGIVEIDFMDVFAPFVDTTQTHSGPIFVWWSILFDGSAKKLCHFICALDYCLEMRRIFSTYFFSGFYFCSFWNHWFFFPFVNCVIHIKKSQSNWCEKNVENISDKD